MGRRALLSARLTPSRFHDCRAAGREGPRGQRASSPAPTSANRLFSAAPATPPPSSGSARSSARESGRPASPHADASKARRELTSISPGPSPPARPHVSGVLLQGEADIRPPVPRPPLPLPDSRALSSSNPSRALPLFPPAVVAKHTSSTPTPLYEPPVRSPPPRSPLQSQYASLLERNSLPLELPDGPSPAPSRRSLPPPPQRPPRHARLGCGASL